LPIIPVADEFPYKLFAMPPCQVGIVLMNPKRTPVIEACDYRRRGKPGRINH
jgi:hypothetical protein